MLVHKHNRWSLCGLASRAALAASSTVMKREVPAVAVAMALMVSAAPAAGQVQQDVQSPGQTSSDTQREPRFVFSFDDHPSFRIGSKVRLDVRFKSQADWRDFPDEDGDSSNDTFDLHRARLGVEGRVSRYLEYQVEREIRDVKRPWRDVFVERAPAARPRGPVRPLQDAVRSRADDRQHGSQLRVPGARGRPTWRRAGISV